MPQVKIYGTQAFFAQARTQLSEVIHACMVTGLGVSEGKRFQRFIGLGAEDFIYPSDRTERYIIIEILMFTGRSLEVKRNLIRLLIAQLSEQVGLDPLDIEITLIETPPSDWGIRGVCGDELSLAYSIQPETKGTQGM